jgi:hypothetical protein
MPSFYRVAKEFPPGEDEYLTPRELGRKPKKGASEEDIQSLDGLSSWDSEAGARSIGQQFPTGSSRCSGGQ